MSEELLINVSPMESRVALLTDGVLREIYIERHNKVGLVGNIYIGTVARVLPGMQAAFVDIGQSRTAFLHANDMQKIRKKKPDNSAAAIQNNTHNNSNNNGQLNIPTHSHLHNPNFMTDNDNISSSLNEQNPTSSTDNNHTSLMNQQASATQVDGETAGNSSNTSADIAQVSKQLLDNTLAETIDLNLPSEASNTGMQASAEIIPQQDNQQLHNAEQTELPTNLAPTTHSVSTLVNTSKTESFFSSKQFAANVTTPESIAAHPQDTDSLLTTNNQQTEDTNTANANLTNSNLDSNNTSDNNHVLDSSNVSNHVLDSNAITQTKADKKVELPKIKILPTVTETLTKRSLNPSIDEKTDSVTVNDHLREAANSATQSTKQKKQPQVNPAELIQNRLREGQQVLVQVTKDQLGTKGARLTTNISLPSRYLVYLPSSDNIGVSQRIEKEEERQRLKTELAALMQKVNLQGSVIARTAAEGISSHKLQEDIEYLLQLWRMIQARKNENFVQKAPVLIYQELSLPLRCLRDLVHEGTERVVVDDAQTYDGMRNFAHEFVPMILPRIVTYHSQQPMFDVYRVEEDLRDALKRRVDLKSGGYLIIDQTEAMTTIDVNTGSFVGARSLEDTVYKTNLEATHAIARQLRLRNLGGIIILDFIDMQEQEHRDDVLISLQTQLSEDYARTNITQVSELGLVEMTRKRTRESLEQLLCEPCHTCQGKGFVKTSETVCFEIFREIMRCARTYDSPKQFTVVAHASVIDLLLTSEADTVADLEYLIGRVITFEVENLYTQEQYDIVLD